MRLDHTIYFETEDGVEIPVTLFVEYTKGSPDYFDKPMGQWYPGYPPELELLDHAIGVVPTGVSVDSGYISRFVDSWWDRNQDQIWSAIDEYGVD